MKRIVLVLVVISLTAFVAGCQGRTDLVLEPAAGPAGTAPLADASAPLKAGDSVVIARRPVPAPATETVAVALPADLDALPPAVEAVARPAEDEEEAPAAEEAPPAEEAPMAGDGAEGVPVEEPLGAGDDTVVVPDTTEVLPLPTADEEAARLLAEARAKADVERQQREVLLRSTLDRAQEAEGAGDLDGARDLYRQALEIDPLSDEARVALGRLTMDRPSTVGEFLDQQRSVETVRRQSAAAEVRNYLEKGRTFEAREDYDAAIKEYQKALAIVSWYTDQRDFGVTADKVRDLIENAKYKREVGDRLDRQEQIRKAQGEREQELVAERERRMGKIRAYFDEANRAFQRGEYALAREYASQILKLDPQNVDADRLVCISYNAEHLRNQEEARRLYDDQWKAVLKDLEYSTLPQVETVVFPDDWLDGIAQRQPYIVGDVATEMDASIAQIYSVLETKRVKGLSWEGANLNQVVSYLRTITGLNFFITPTALAEKGDEVEVSLQLDDVAVKDVLDFVTEPNELRWEPRNGVVVIATGGEVRGDMLLRFFDVKDLNVAIRNFVGQEINLVPSNFTPPEPPELPDPAPIFPAEGLVELIRETIGQEGTWDEPATIEARNGIIIARNTSTVLEQVEQLLDELRRNSGLLVNLEVRFLTAEDNFLRDVGVDVRGLGDNSQGIGAPGLGTDAPQDDIFFGSNANPYGVPFGVFPEPPSAGTSDDSGIFYNDGQDGAYQGRVENLYDVLLGNPEVLTGSGGLSFQHTYLDDTEIEVILRAVEKSERIQQVTASRITVYNTQRANVSVLNQVSYVQDYEVEIAQASNIANPVIQTIQDGVVLDVRPVVSQDRRFVTLELRPTVALLTRPIATFSTSLASGPVTASAPVVIQIPELQVSRVRTTVVMPDGGTLLLGGLKFYEQVDENTGVPFLSCLPVLGFLFSRKGNYVNRRNLLVLIKAEIVALDELEPNDDLDVPAAPISDWTPMVEMDDLAPGSPCAPPAPQMGPCTPPPCETAPVAPPPCDPCRRLPGQR